MKGYSELDLFKPWAVRAYARATQMVDGILSSFEDDGEEWIRCHEVARAVLPFLDRGWEVVDGRYQSVQHSWLLREGVILDVYAVARLPMVHLVGGHWSSLDAYVLGPKRRDIRDAIVASLMEDIRMGGFQCRG